MITMLLCSDAEDLFWEFQAAFEVERSEALNGSSAEVCTDHLN